MAKTCVTMLPSSLNEMYSNEGQKDCVRDFSKILKPYSHRNCFYVKALYFSMVQSIFNNVFEKKNSEKYHGNILKVFKIFY